MKINQTNEGQRKYVLYFDINKTIILADAKYSDQSKEECLQEILVGYSWGKLEQKDEKSPVQWRLTHATFQSTNPGDGMMSYKEYISQQFPLKSITDEANAERRQEYNNDMIQQRRQIIYSFVKQGSPCLKLKPEYDRIVKLITLPKAVIEELKQKIDDQIDQQSPRSLQKKSLATLLQEKDNMADIFGDGKFNIIPTFFKTIINLKKQKREFAIVFRPFGTDPKQVVREFNRFCIGEHPCFSGRNNTPIVRFDGSKGTKNYIIQERQCGIFYRYETDINKTQLAIGSLRRGDKKKALEDEYEKEIEEEAVTLQKNIGGIYLQIMEQLKEVIYNSHIKQSCGLCLQDDFQFYQTFGEEAGEDQAKLMFIDPTDYDTQHIFFDDNIQDNDFKNLVGVIDAITCNKIKRKRSLNKYLVHVDIIDAIKDPDYFIKMIDQCDKSRGEEIERIEKGIPDDVPEIPKKSDFELLQEASDSEYLRKTILPLLLPAMQLVDQERPSDPLTFIALYCLKNKDRVKIPQPSQEYLESLNLKDDEGENKKN